MTEKFTASNGVEISITSEGIETYLIGEGGVISGGERRWVVATGNKEGTQALREFFLHERDQELGWWRYPDNPDYVVKPRTQKIKGKRVVRVFRESTGNVNDIREVEPIRRSDDSVNAAHAYFAAHPEKKPLPTEPGSVLQGTGTNRTILHRSYPVNGRESDHPWTALGGATYADEDVPEFFHGKFIQLVPKGDS